MAFVTADARRELDRRRLLVFVAELEQELGPADETEVARYGEMLAASAALARDGEGAGSRYGGA